MKISTKRRYETVTIHIDEETLEAVRLIAKREGVSVNQLICDVIHLWLFEEK